MEKKSFKSFVKKNESSQEKLEHLEEKFQRIKGILKQALNDLKNEKAQKETLQAECAKLAAEVKEKDELLQKMHSVSEAVVDEFSALRVKCDMETEAANNAIKRATRYFQENQKLKSNPISEISTKAKNTVNESSDNESYENESELEILNSLNSELRTEVATLKTKLNKEVEKQSFLKEDFEIAKNLYEQEMREHKGTTEKLESLELLYDSVVKAIDSRVISEDSSSENICNNHFLGSNRFNVENSVGNSLKPAIENSIKRDAASTLAVIEKQRDLLRSQIRELERQILNLKLNCHVEKALSVPPPPPPPPPPPLPPPSFNPLKSLMTFIHASKKSPRKISLPAPESVPAPKVTKDGHQKAMSEMMNAIKNGNIHLKPVPKVNCEKESNTSDPVALVEMKSILQSLKKRKKDDSLQLPNETNFKSDVVVENEGCNISSGDGRVSPAVESMQEQSDELTSDSDNSFSKELDVISDEDVSITPTISVLFSDSNGNEFKYPEISPSSNDGDDDDNCVMII